MTSPLLCRPTAPPTISCRHQKVLSQIRDTNLHFSRFGVPHSYLFRSVLVSFLLDLAMATFKHRRADMFPVRWWPSHHWPSSTRAPAAAPLSVVCARSRLEFFAVQRVRSQWCLCNATHNREKRISCCCN